MQAARGAPLTSSGSDTPSRRRLRIILALCAATAYSIDLVTKSLALKHLSASDPVEVLGPLLRLTLVFNPGAAFSTGTSFTVALSMLAIAAVITVLVLATRVGTTGWAVALGLLLGGVAGNLTDRIFRDPSPLRGHVIDFLQLPNWPVFNIADICINVAAGLIIVLTWRGVPLRGHPPADASAAPSDAENGTGERAPEATDD